MFFLCTILSSFFAMRSTSWSFTMFAGLGLFNGARWPCLHLCGEMSPSLCVAFSGSMRGICCLSLRSRMLYRDVRIASESFFSVESFHWIEWTCSGMNDLLTNQTEQFSSQLTDSRRIASFSDMFKGLNRARNVSWSDYTHMGER